MATHRIETLKECQERMREEYRLAKQELEVKKVLVARAKELMDYWDNQTEEPTDTTVARVVEVPEHVKQAFDDAAKTINKAFNE